MTRAELALEEARTDATTPLWRLSMPAAELFGCFAVAAVAAAARGAPPRAVISIGDCDPAAAALNAATSPRPQMRHILGGARQLSSQWLGGLRPQGGKRRRGASQPPQWAG
eukprot:701149-Pleurochrysis_carterae.AAC.1